MNNTNLRERPARYDTQFRIHVAQLLEADIYQWLAQLERHGSTVWTDALPKSIAARCREASWTQVRVVQPDCQIAHELTAEGQMVLQAHRRAQGIVDALALTSPTRHRRASP